MHPTLTLLHTLTKTTGSPDSIAEAMGWDRSTLFRQIRKADEQFSVKISWSKDKNKYVIDNWGVFSKKKVIEVVDSRTNCD
ncbi:MAG: hypothetical protein OEZ68_15710 [Gammaproteobacteria bacterium]|nr:hypothetical protein [Gammaproteobacteria bacterium]MDH5802247.1 hypothetical protein [Gammaproteobacteria bacterium]